MFKIGDKVIALVDNDEGDIFHKGKIYEIKAILYCAKCGIQNVNISGAYTSVGFLRCTTGCGYVQPCDSLEYYDAKYFAKLNEIENKIKEAVEDEDYELAHELSQYV